MAFAVGVALSFFPADNFGTVLMMLAARLTHQDLWPQLTQYFLGPVLNQLPVSLQTDRKLGASFASPLVPVDATHCWVVIRWRRWRSYWQSVGSSSSGSTIPRLFWC